MKQLGELKVADYMTTQAVVVDDSQKLAVAIGLMEHHRLSVLPVVNSQGEIVGIISTSDVLEITHEIQSDISALNYVTDTTRDFLITMLAEKGESTFIRDVMTSPVETTAPQTNLVVAARQLVDRNYHHLPVVDDDGRPIGLLSTSDFVRAFSEHGATLAG